MPLLRPLFKRRFAGLKSSNNKPSSYELPRYAPRSGKSDSSGLTKIRRGRTPIRSSRGAASVGVGAADDDDSSMEGILLPAPGKDDSSVVVRPEGVHAADGQRRGYGIVYHAAAKDEEEGGATGPSEHALK